ncbi:hypothetical protein NE237_023394 [Protea cynaroides]|uniref:RING-type E3 ubiquitin transferase n=1 Tax=Protea cynaroides TaxID=273540 RepID=A0A9Q0K642_9MAGN|nr:hypothetical protein NE237_023394 [Protea cynaroides]
MSSSSSSLAGLANIVSFFVISIIVILYTLRRIYVWCVHLRNRRRHEQRYPQIIIAIGASQVPSLDRPRTGLDPSIIALLPTFIYKKSDVNDGTAATECSICLSSLEEEEMVRLLPNCLHLFHTQCIDIWLSSQSTCPICRTMAEPQAPLVPEQELEIQTHGTDDEVPPLEPLNSITPSLESNQSDEIAESSKVGGSSSQSSSFRKIISWNRSEKRVQPFEVSADAVEDLEMQ